METLDWIRVAALMGGVILWGLLSNLTQRLQALREGVVHLETLVESAKEDWARLNKGGTTRAKRRKGPLDPI